MALASSGPSSLSIRMRISWASQLPDWVKLRSRPTASESSGCHGSGRCRRMLNSAASGPERIAALTPALKASSLAHQLAPRPPLLPPPPAEPPRRNPAMQLHLPESVLALDETDREGSIKA